MYPRTLFINIFYKALFHRRLTCPCFISRGDLVSNHPILLYGWDHRSIRVTVVGRHTHRDQRSNVHTRQVIAPLSDVSWEIRWLIVEIRTVGASSDGLRTTLEVKQSEVIWLDGLVKLRELRYFQRLWERTCCGSAGWYESRGWTDGLEMSERVRTLVPHLILFFCAFFEPWLAQWRTRWEKCEKKKV